MSTKQDCRSLLKLSRYFFPVMEANGRAVKEKHQGLFRLGLVLHY